MRSYPVKENHIRLVVSEILWYTHTDRRRYFEFLISEFKTCLYKALYKYNFLSLKYLNHLSLEPVLLPNKINPSFPSYPPPNDQFTVFSCSDESNGDLVCLSWFRIILRPISYNRDVTIDVHLKQQTYLDH